MTLNPSLPRSARAILPLLALPMLGACNLIVLDPAGDVARQQGNLVMMSTALMLLIIVPVMAATAVFAWRYRAGNKAATYKPDWDHSTQLELLIWAAPLMIIICLGALTWVGTHLLDPYRPLARTAPGKVVAATTAPMEVQVVALNWKWLFIYPELGVASVNELALPVDRPVQFRISSSSVMNSFYVPAMAGQIYAMPGMETKLHGVLNERGNFTGFSANYSGAGFSNMRFAVKSLDQAGFDAWAAGARGSSLSLDRAAYLKLEKPSVKAPVMRFASVERGLFDRIVNLCVEPGKMCMHDMMAIDAKGGMGRAGLYNVRQLEYDKARARGSNDQRTAATETKAYVAELCTNPDMLGKGVAAAMVRRVDLTPLIGAGLPRPRAGAANGPATAQINPVPLS
ncbi:ubiquinol oxidase subunit II [Sphingomonas sp. BGYR3]|uniref:ubiquinol oxidase subunit II n=1 Tax=Sphingomonas sp. BGYR3 TaxID=2975483 RepID=UPI0021A4BB96|nr:ubiquinol oxidase subunit II [Sphingomonas sp. BGYR3]MDG5487250.1 ubiquinol oxidase subunit II [Sphingomonas sp. BGYR3]